MSSSRRSSSARRKSLPHASRRFSPIRWPTEEQSQSQQQSAPQSSNWQDANAIRQDSSRIESRRAPGPIRMESRPDHNSRRHEGFRNQPTQPQQWCDSRSFRGHMYQGGVAPARPAARGPFDRPPSGNNFSQFESYNRVLQQNYNNFRQPGAHTPYMYASGFSDNSDQFVFTGQTHGHLAAAHNDNPSTTLAERQGQGHRYSHNRGFQGVGGEGNWTGDNNWKERQNGEWRAERQRDYRNDMGRVNGNRGYQQPRHERKEGREMGTTASKYKYFKHETVPIDHHDERAHSSKRHSTTKTANELIASKTTVKQTDPMVVMQLIGESTKSQQPEDSYPISVDKAHSKQDTDISVKGDNNNGKLLDKENSKKNETDEGRHSKVPTIELECAFEPDYDEASDGEEHSNSNKRKWDAVDDDDDEEEEDDAPRVWKRQK